MVLVAAGLISAPVSARQLEVAQSTEYRLGDDRQWATTAPPPEPGSDAALIADARRLLAEDNPGAAQALLDPWIERTERESNPYRAEALLLRGDARLAQDREYKSLYDYEEVIRNHRASEQFPIAVERELDIAIRYANGLKIRTLGFRIGDSDEVAVELFIRVQERLPRSQLAEKASIELADFYYRQRDMKQAFDAYDLYLQNFPNGPNSLHARQRRIQADLARFKGPRYNAAELINARERIREFVRRYPAEADATGMNEALVARIEESMGAQLLDTAQWYLKRDDPTSARFALGRLQRDFPATLAAQRGEALMRENDWNQDPIATEPADQEAPAEPPADEPATEPAP
jgi:tetratricopeptide (TPR) repeat protein